MILNQQKPASPEYTKDGSLVVHSTFDTIQGEGPFAGIPSVFVRLSDCNLECNFCDTDYTSVRNKMAPEELCDKVMEWSTRKLVVFTGGEPLRQNITPAIDLIVSTGRRVQIETNGTLYLQSLEKYKHIVGKVYIVCSPKTPAINKSLFPLIHHFKYVVAHDNIDEDDGLPLKSVGPQYGRPARPTKEWVSTVGHEIYVQPLDMQDEEENKKNMQAAVESCMRYGYRLSIQMHKICGLP